MANSITGKEYPLDKIFDSDFEYHIPSYQRPYSWTEEESSELFDDLYDFSKTEKEDNYFLGSIVLIKEDNRPESQVIDGQQRLTTLTILLSVLASKLTGDDLNDIKSYILQQGSRITGVQSKPRLTLRTKDQQFFNQYIQNLNIDGLLKLNDQNFQTESQEHIYKNTKVFIGKVEEYLNGKNEIFDFCQFLVTRCFIVVVSTPSQQSAFRVFSVMNSRGMDLLPIDIIKSDVIGKISLSEQDLYTDKWENLEIMTGRAGFNEVFAHTRMIFTKAKQKKTLLEEFKEYVLTKVTPKQLIDEVLEPYCEAYSTIKKCNYVSSQNASEVNTYLMWLNKIDNSDWMPVAIRFYSQYNADNDYLLWFFKKLERLSAYLMITNKDVNKRIERFKWILDELDRKNTSLQNSIETIELTSNEIKEFKAKLDGEIYTITSRKRNYIILRLDSFVSDCAAIYDPTILTIEHVLPQTVELNSEWDKVWPNVDERTKWLNRIGNLVPLTRKHNSAAQNFDFKDKKEKYFKGKNKTSSYALTTQVINYSTWTVEDVENRQKQLMNDFIRNWELVDTAGDTSLLEFHLTLRGASASGFKSGNGFTVTKGSIIASDETASLQQSYRDIRKQLHQKGILSNYMFTVDYTFESVSQASCVVSGRSSNGRSEWATIDGKTFSDVYGK